MARDRNFQRKQKDARMPARDSHGEDRMAARQGEPDFDLRRARDAPSSGTSRNRRQAAPVQTETYGSDIFAGCENSDTAAQDSPIQVFPGQEPTGSEPYAPETGPKDSGRGSQAQGNATYQNFRQEEPRQADFSQESPGRRNTVYQNFRQEEPRQADFSQESPGRRNAAYRNSRQEEPKQADSGQENPGQTALPNLQANRGCAWHITGIRRRRTAGWQNCSRDQPGPMPGLPTGRLCMTARS